MNSSDVWPPGWGGLAEERITTRAWRNRSSSTDCRHLDETRDRAFRGVGEGEGKGGLEVDVGCWRRGFGGRVRSGGRGMGMLVWVQKRRGDVGIGMIAEEAGRWGCLRGMEGFGIEKYSWRWI